MFLLLTNHILNMQPTSELSQHRELMAQQLLGPSLEVLPLFDLTLPSGWVSLAGLLLCTSAVSAT